MGNTQTSFRRNMQQLPKASQSTATTVDDDERIQLNAIRANLRNVPEEWIVQIEAAVRKWDEKLSIHLTGKNLTSLPAWIQMNSHAEMVGEIDLSKNRLREFPSELIKFQRLERLGLGSNDIGAIPDEIGKLKNLVWFDFTHNRIAHVSDQIGGLPKLVSLGASDCRLTTFPLAITKLKKLKKLGCFNNLFTSLPPEIGNLTSLTKLDMSGNNLSTLPVEIGKLPNLAWLNVSNNRIESLPNELGQLTNLKELGMANNCLRRLPDLSRLNQLTLLTVFNNQLEEIGEWIGEMGNLIKIDLSSNRLTKLPERVLALPHLQLLNVRNNKISNVPPPNPLNHHQRPRCLQVLDLRDNRIVSLPFGVLGAETILIAGNPLLGEALEIGSVVPPLRLLAIASTIAGHDLPGARSMLDKWLTPTLRDQFLDVWEGREGFVCQHCRGIFLHAPLRFIDSIQASDEQVIPCVVQLCSSACRNSFIRNSASSQQRRRSAEYAMRT